MSDDDDTPEEGDPFDTAAGLHMSIDFDVKNYKLSPKKRAVLRRMILRMVQEASVKVELLATDAIRVYAEERSSSHGARPIRVPLDGGDDDV